jgi:ribonuclease HI
MVVVYVDGSYAPNITGPASAGVGLYIDDQHLANIRATIIADNITNGTVELIGIYMALVLTHDCDDVKIFSDSQHAVEPLSLKHDEYIRSGWRTRKNKPIADHDIFVACSNIILGKRARSCKVRVKKVQAHCGIAGNDIADKLAYSAMTGTECISIVQSVAISIVVKDSICSAVYNCASFRDLQKYFIRKPRVTSVSSAQKSDVREIIDSILETGAAESTEMWTRSIRMSENSQVKLLKWPDSESMPDPDYVSEKHIFIFCMSHAGMIWIRYPTGHSISSSFGPEVLNNSTIICSVCRICMASHNLDNEKLNPVARSLELHKMVSALHMSTSIIKTSSIGICADEISSMDSTVLQRDGYVRYISIMDISMKCDNLCKVVSVDINERYAYEFLKMGFL